jgi:hypothetical protein
MELYEMIGVVLAIQPIIWGCESIFSQQRELRSLSPDEGLLQLPVRVPGWFQVHVRVQLRLLGWFSLKLDTRSLPTTFAVRDTA